MDRRGCWPIARRAWAEPLISSHRLVLEDDAILCAGFADRLQQVVELAPAAVVSLFRGARQCSVATVMPNAFIPRWLDWAGRASRARPHHDQLIALGCLAIGVPHLYASPSLVEHAAVPSLLDHPPVAALRFDPSPTTVVLES